MAGSVRAENEDICRLLTIGNTQILIMADGMGGLTHGKRAARRAVAAAWWSLRQSLDSRRRTKSRPSGFDLPKLLHVDCPPSRRLEDWARKAIQTGAMGMSKLVCRSALSAEQFGTTLMIVIACPGKIAWAYLGDGGIMLVRPASQFPFKDLIRPQKEFQNALENYLSSEIVGTIKTGSLELQRGDLIVMGTDGVFDHMDHTALGRLVLDRALRSRGDLKSTATGILQQFCSTKTEAGYPYFTDNLTLGLIGTRVAPVIPAGFWRNPLATQPLARRSLLVEAVC